MRKSLKCLIIAIQFLAVAPYVKVASAASNAEHYPNRPIRLMGLSVGGTTDVLSRVIGPRLTEKWGQPIVVDNRFSAGGILPAETTARATPDGHTMIMGNAIAFVSALYLFKYLPYDPEKDFTPITMVATTTNVLVVHPSVPVGNVKELIAYAKQKGPLTYGTVGPGSLGHLTGELLKQTVDIGLTHVPYRGGGAAVTGIISGEVQVSFLSPITAHAQLKSGKVRALAVTSKSRSPAVPDIPSAVEAGVPEMEALLWFALFAPAHTPRPIVTKINNAVAEILQRDDVKRVILQLGGEARSSTPEQLRAWLKSELAKWGPIIRNAGIKAN
ncbi:MAG: hypothetical protein A3H97_11695 [Acidobacteria bacterium RIFCSPLOWO2_02_FULL_65_29]|nr:MAG: hypothetical protein A3H97_11695 [Acidobacteria bacterium RIFCSPLOWO2_02_FULL_65_29]